MVQTTSSSLTDFRQEFADAPVRAYYRTTSLESDRSLPIFSDSQKGSTVNTLITESTIKLVWKERIIYMAVK